MSKRRFATLLLMAATACRREELPSTAPPAGPPRVDGDIALSSEERAHMGLAFAPIEALDWIPEVRVFGRVVHDPSAIATLVAPLSGRLRAKSPLPAPGTEIQAGRELFCLEPRWTPQELADREERRASANAERTVAEAEVPALRTAVERARRLNAADQSVSDRELEETEARLLVAEARVEGARALEAALSGAAGEVPLRLSRGGTLIELAAHDGEEVEAGRELVRVEDLRAPLVELDLPVRARGLADAPRARVELDASGDDVPAVRIGPAPLAGTGGLAPALLFRLDPGAEPILARPGQSVLAWLQPAEPALAGARIPSAAVVRVAGRAFVYARLGGEDRLARVAVDLDRPVPGGWFVTGLDPTTELVVQGAQSVLSFELLGRQTASEED